MGTFEVLGLAGLALIDSTSIGTLVIPLVLILRPRIRPRLVLLYVATIALFYLGIGLLVTAGLGSVLPGVSGLLDTTAAPVVLLVVGVALLVLSFVIDPKAVARRRERRGLPPRPAARWFERMERAADRPGTMVSLALGAGLVEVATMLPYLAAIGIIVAAGLPALGSGLVLAGYVLVMVLPAAVLLLLRLTAGSRLEAPLQRLRDWIVRHSGASTSWTVGIIGFLLARYGVDKLIPVLTADG